MKDLIKLIFFFNILAQVSMFCKKYFKKYYSEYFKIMKKKIKNVFVTPNIKTLYKCSKSKSVGIKKMVVSKYQTCKVFE